LHLRHAARDGHQGRAGGRSVARGPSTAEGNRKRGVVFARQRELDGFVRMAIHARVALQLSMAPFPESNDAAIEATVMGQPSLEEPVALEVLELIGCVL